MRTGGGGAVAGEEGTQRNSTLLLPGWVVGTLSYLYLLQVFNIMSNGSMHTHS